MEQFEAHERIQLDLRCAGWAFVMRFQRGGLARFTGTVSTREPHVVLKPFSGEGRRGVFDRGNVRIESADGTVVSERVDARAAFGGRRNLWWDDLDLLYFGAYALWGYVCAPFMFKWPGFAVEEAEPWREGEEEWPGLKVRFPEELPAHSREQTYYFGPDGLIRRNDYTAEVFGGWAKAAHYCLVYGEFGGIVVPTRRRVMPRGPGGRPIRPVTIVSIAVDDVRPA
jgi:hypothetical protein